ncbi:hypothetical protein ES703_98752 [subsurface metagenome]
MLWIPVYLLVAGNKGFLDCRRPDIPGLLGVVEERRLTAPAEGIGMPNLLTAEEQSS